MKKLIAFIMAVCVCAGGLALSACDKGGNENPSGQITPEEVKKSEYELFLENNGWYKGNEQQWLRDKAAGLLDENKNYGLVNGGVCAGETVAGSAVTEGDLLKLKDCVIKLNENAVIPVSEGSEWEIKLGGILSTSTASSEILTSRYDGEIGRIYFGVYAARNIAYMGVNIGTYYINYCWYMSGEYINTPHDYVIRYKNGLYGLSVDGGDFENFSSVNCNQANSVNITSPERASAELNAKIRAACGQDYFAFNSIGANTHKCTCELEYVSVKTSRIYGYKKLTEHPLAGKIVYHLGSSISYGHANGGVSFAEQIASLTDSEYVKETVSGTTLSTARDNSYVRRWEKLDFTAEPDFLILQLSTNDFANGITEGDVSEELEGFDTSTLTGAIEHIIAKTREVSPDTQIIIYTCAIRDGWAHKAKYGNYIKVKLPKISEKWKVAVADIYNTETYGSDWMGDDIHPNGAGYANMFTPALINAMLSAK